MLPNWLKQAQTAPRFYCNTFALKKRNYLRKTIDAIRNFMNETFLQEKEANKDGLLQNFDNRLKFVCAMFLIILLSSAHHAFPLLIVYLLLLLLAGFSKLGLRSFVLRSFLTAGFFSILVMLPASLNVFIDGKTVLRLGASLAVTDNGIRFLFLFSMRALTMVSVVTLLLSTTKREDLLAALKRVHFPAVFIIMISMSYRFIAVLVRVVENLHFARKSRTIKMTNAKTERRWVASGIGWTFLKAVSISNEVTQAMISRGWRGDARGT